MIKLPTCADVAPLMAQMQQRIDGGPLGVKVETRCTNSRISGGADIHLDIRPKRRFTLLRYAEDREWMCAAHVYPREGRARLVGPTVHWGYHTVDRGWSGLKTLNKVDDTHRLLERRRGEGQLEAQEAADSVMDWLHACIAAGRRFDMDGTVYRPASGEW